MIYFINGLHQWSGYKRFDWSVVGESACADSWGRRPHHPGEPSLSIPVLRRAPLRPSSNDEMLMALPPAGLSQGHRRHARVSQATASATPSPNMACSRVCAPAWP